MTTTPTDPATARINAGADALRATGYTGCVCLWHRDRNPDAAAAAHAMLVAMGWRS